MTSDVDPRAQAERKFATAEGIPETFDVIMRYATDPALAVATLIEALRPATRAGARICEMGFGNGWLLEDMAAAFPAPRLYGLDQSPAMIEYSRTLVGDRVSFVRGDMERLPFRDGAFDAIATCWTLYFMRDIDAALEGMRRCLRAGGIFVTATNCPDHMRELDEMMREAQRAALGREPEPDVGARFDTASGEPYVRRHFDNVELREWSGEMVLPDVASALALWRNYGPQELSPEDNARAKEAFAELARERIARDGALRLTRHNGAFVGFSRSVGR